MSFAKEKALEYHQIITDNDYDDYTASTCDHSKWDRKLHRHFPLIAEELRKLGYYVTSSVNHGVTDFVIIKQEA